MAQHTNRLLRLLDRAALSELGELQVVPLPMRQQLDPDPSDGGVYFPEQGVVSVVADDQDGKMAVEIGLIGNEGMVGLDYVYDDPTGPFRSFVQVDGSAVRVDAKRLINLIDANTEARRLFFRYARAFTIQIASTALSNGRNKLDERLARWLLMVSDRAGTTFPITHEFISIMLAVRRAGVTVAIQVLEGNGLIRASRGSITILDRKGLVATANGAYGFAEEHYRRLLGEAR